MGQRLLISAKLKIARLSLLLGTPVTGIRSSLLNFLLSLVSVQTMLRLQDPSSKTSSRTLERVHNELDKYKIHLF